MSNPKKRALLVPVAKGDPSIPHKKQKTETGARVVLSEGQLTGKENETPDLGQGLSLGGEKAVSAIFLS
jgi:hypothetical protein